MGKGKGKSYYRPKGNGGTSDFSRAHGKSAFLCTCDSNRGREASKEIVNLLTQTMEILSPNEKAHEEKTELLSSSVGDSTSLSVADMLKHELNDVKEDKSDTKDFVSINTGVKGVVLVICRRDSVCPIDMVQNIFDRVKEEKMSVSRHLNYITPMQIICRGNIESFEKQFVKMVKNILHYSPDDDSNADTKSTEGEGIEEPAPKKQRTESEVKNWNDTWCCIMMKNTCNDQLKKSEVFSIVQKHLPSEIQFVPSTLLPAHATNIVYVCVRGLKSICGISISINKKLEFPNMRKVQEEFCIAENSDTT